MCERCTEYKNRARAAETEAETLRTENAILRLRLDAGSPKEYALTFYTVEEVSERLRISAYTLKRYISSGKLPAFQEEKGSLIRIAHNDLMNFIAARTRDKLETYEC